MKKKKMILCAVAFTAAAAVTISAVYIHNVPADKSSADNKYREYEKVKKIDLKKVTTVMGIVDSVDTASINSDISDSKITGLYVKVGDRVKKGDVIARLDTKNIDDSLKVAEAGLEAERAKARLSDESAAYDNENTEKTTALQNKGAVHDTNKAEADTKKAETKLSNLEKKYKKAKKKYTEKKKKVKAEKKKQKKEDLKVRNLTTQINDLNYELDDIKTQISDTENRINELNSKISESEADAKSQSISDSSAAGSDESGTSGSYRSEMTGNRENDSSGSREKTSGSSEIKTSAETALLKKQLEDEKNTLASLNARAKSFNTEIVRLSKLNDAEKYKQEDAQTAVSDAQEKLTRAESVKTDTKSRLDQAKETRSTMKDTYKKSVNTEKETVLNSKKALKESQNTSETNKISEKSTVISAEKEVEKYNDQKNNAILRAPISGIITVVDVRQGDAYKGGEIVKIQDDSGYKVKANIDQYNISDIKKGMEVQIKSDIFRNKVLHGRLSFVAPTTNVSESTSSGSSGDAGSDGAQNSSAGTDYAVEAKITDKSRRLRIGMKVKLMIIEKEKKDVLCVPRTAIRKNSTGRKYIVSGREKIYIKTGMKNDYYTEITGNGIKENMNIEE